MDVNDDGDQFLAKRGELKGLYREFRDSMMPFMPLPCVSDKLGPEEEDAFYREEVMRSLASSETQNYVVFGIRRELLSMRDETSELQFMLKRARGPSRQISAVVDLIDKALCAIDRSIRRTDALMRPAVLRASLARRRSTAADYFG